MDIYWIQDHEKKGPLPEVEVISMLEAGLIPETTRGVACRMRGMGAHP